MKIVIGCDPNAQSVKEEVIAYINKKGYGIVDDFGSDDVIYAHVAISVAEAVASGEYDAAQRARLSNDANILCLGAFTTGLKTRETIIDAFFTNKFEPEGVSKGSVPKVEAFRKYESSHIN